MNGDRPRVLPSALKHGVPDDDARHAWAFAVVSIGVQEGVEVHEAGAMMPRSLDELIAQSEGLAEVFEAFDPEDGVGPEPPMMALRRAAYRRTLSEVALAEAVASARSAGVSWTKIGAMVGTSGEAARQRYGHQVA